MSRHIQLFLSFLFMFAAANSQPPFYSDIQNFKKQDSTHFPPAHAILFIGSSSFTKWTDIQDYFPRYPIINRAFGGSTLEDVIRYSDDIIFPYHPKQIVIYCGENDLAASDTVTAQDVFSRFKKLFTTIRHHYPRIPVVYVSMKPSPSRKHLISKFITGNALIKNYLITKQNTRFIDVFHKMLNSHGYPISNIFVEDSLHMNSKGYVMWQKAIAPYLIK
ncbi:MAG: GDSL-type esterase/lipase family protein [Ginsengibacter sp.]